MCIHVQTCICTHETMNVCNCASVSMYVRNYICAYLIVRVCKYEGARVYQCILYNACAYICTTVSAYMFGQYVDKHVSMCLCLRVMRVSALV